MTKAKPRILPKLVAISLAFGASAMLSPLAAQDVVVGVTAPITGANAAFGEQIKRGAELAIEDANTKGGLNGHKIVLKIGDDACDPKQGVSVANTLTTAKAVAVIGSYCSGTSIPASDVYHEENVVQITPASTNPKFTERGYDNLFRTCGRDDKQGIVAGGYLAKEYKGKKIAIVDDKSAYGKGLADETRKALVAAGGKEALDEEITAGEKDYTALVSRLKEQKVDAVYFGGYHPELGLIVRQAREQGLTAQFISGDAMATQEFWSITGPAGTGTLFTFEPDWRKAPSAQDLVKRFKDTGYDPEGYTLNTYAAVQVLTQAAAKAKSVASKDIAKAIHGGTFETALGRLTYDAKGDVENPKYVFYEFKDGKYAER